MAAYGQQPQFQRRVPPVGLVLIVAVLLAWAALALLGPAARAGEVPASGYALFKGEPFFLLADASYGSNDVARVRLEVPGRDAARANLEAYSGVDIVVYRVPQPIEFLKRQKNLHRIEVAGSYQGEGLANTLRYLWDSWWKQSRLIWRKIFSPDARLAVTRAQPALATDAAIHRPTVFTNGRQYKPLQGFDMIDGFRYPLWAAAPIAPPKGVELDGSSSGFITPGEGNVMIPIGKRKPGLYLVEAIIGEHRATTLVFVSDTMAVTKVSAGQMLVWTARRDTGAAVADARVVWTDGTGVLQSGSTGRDGVAALERGSPEHTYVLGEDAEGGVFIGENFYYDSEIFNTKIYAVTDRPLYRPGDEVAVKFIAREFLSARNSRPAVAGPVALTVFDPNGTPLLSQTLQLAPDSGADTRFRLPESASAGGYELRFAYQDGTYGAAFRVAEYVKPHFAIDVIPAKSSFKTGEPVAGTISLRYPDGTPVRDAALSLTLRGQRNTMVEGELRYGGMFPVTLKTQDLATDAGGNAKFELPPMADPSRYVLTVLATDGAAYRVKTTRELLVERAAGSFQLRARRQFSDPGKPVHFDLVPDGAAPARPVRWQMVRLENQARTEGAYDDKTDGWDVHFPGPGSYQLSLRDERGNLVAATSHWVSGDGVQTTPGSIEIVLDRARYAPGDTAEALVTFPQPVEQALLTLERDKVEHHGLIKGGGDWFRAERVAPRQWRVRLPVRDDFGPNITFSVAYVRAGEFVFENAGLQVIEPRIALQFKADREVYQPGERVTLDVTATLDGKPVSTMLTLGIVDEMVYVLQPEIAPDIADFFYHARRNNVRTTASLSFISYDMARGRGGDAPARHNYNERGVKVLERPRRDDKDTALWAPSLRTDADGHVRVTFAMPDNLTRWRITGRAMDDLGRVGQRIGYLRSDKAFYAKWTAPSWKRAGDTPRAALAVFNQTGREQALDVVIAGGTYRAGQKLAARPGVNYVTFPLPLDAPRLRIEVRRAGQLVDALDAPLRTIPVAWRGAREKVVALSAADAALKLPADAANIRVAFASDAAGHFARIADDLVDFPYGGVEQTASRMIPLALAAQALVPGADGVRARVMATLQAQRLRLVSMAGPDAVFGWWGNGTAGDPLMTAYAYYSDWLASRTLGIALPPEHWNNVLTVYQKDGLKSPLLDRALVLWLVQQMGLPTRTLAAGLVEDSAANAPDPQAGIDAADPPPVLGGRADAGPGAFGLALLGVVAARNEVALPPSLHAQVDVARAQLARAGTPLGQALSMLAGELPSSQADVVLAAVRADTPTIERALVLLWVHKALGGAAPAPAAQVALGDGWQQVETRLGQAAWLWRGEGVPAHLRLAQPAPPGTVAVVQYDSTAAEPQALPVRIERRLLQMVADGDHYRTEPVDPAAPLRTDALYLDEVTLHPGQGARYRFGMLEVALPPGASVEATTWGIRLAAAEETAPLERARHVERADGYAVPIENLDGTLVVRHLVRFAQKGGYVLPPARFYRLYQPGKKALENAGKGHRTVRVE